MKDFLLGKTSINAGINVEGEARPREARIRAESGRRGSPRRP